MNALTQSYAGQGFLTDGALRIDEGEPDRYYVGDTRITIVAFG